MTKPERLAIHCSGGLRPPEIGDQRSPLQGDEDGTMERRNSIYDSRYRDPNRNRDRNRRESKEFDPDSDFDCRDVP
jgi:hypothetical protein